MKREISEHFEEQMPIVDTHELILAFASVVLTSILTPCFTCAIDEYMMTSSNGTFSTLLAICAGNSPVSGEFTTQRPVTRFDVFFDLRLNKRLSKQWLGWWFETLARPLWRHCNE